LLTIGGGRDASRPEFQVDQDAVARFGGHAGFGRGFRVDGGEFEEFYGRTHNEPDFQQPQISARTESGSVPEPEVQHFLYGNAFPGEDFPALRGKLSAG